MAATAHMFDVGEIKRISNVLVSDDASQMRPFEWAAHAHTILNLHGCMPYFNDEGRICGTDGKPLSREENRYTIGLLMPYDSDSIKKIILETVLRKKGIGDTKKIASFADFIDYLANLGDDTTCFCNTKQREITETGILKNDYPNQIPDLDALVDKILPKDFPKEVGDFGGKISVGVQIPIMSDRKGYSGVGVVLLRNYVRSEETAAGIGDVVHLTYDGVLYSVEEIHFKKDPNANKNQYIIPEHKIVGVHKVYKTHNNGRVVLDEKTTLDTVAIDGRRYIHPKHFQRQRMGMRQEQVRSYAA